MAEPPTQEAKDYERWGLPLGMTVAEWERKHNYLPYTVYPEAKKATEFQRGYYMYRIATDEERKEMELRRGRKKHLNPSNSKKDRRAYYRAWYAKQRAALNAAARASRRRGIRFGLRRGHGTAISDTPEEKLSEEA